MHIGVSNNVSSMYAEDYLYFKCNFSTE